MITKPAGTPMTEPQFGYLIKLITQAHPDPSNRSAALVAAAGFDFPTASAAIDSLKASIKVMPTSMVPTLAAPAYIPPFGSYLIDGKIFKVKKPKYSGAPTYLILDEKFVGSIEKPSAQSLTALAQIDTPDKALAAVIAYAAVTHRCGVCHLKLTDPKSIAQGIGPVCIKKYGKSY